MGKGYAVAKYIGLAQNQVFRLLDVGIDRLVGLLGATGRSPPAPAKRPSTLRNPRRDTGSIHSDLLGNSRCTISPNSGVSANSSRLRQYFLPVLPASFTTDLFERQALGLFLPLGLKL